MSLTRLRDFTSARVGLERTGNSLRTREMLDLQFAQARAREAVRSKLDVSELASALRQESPDEPILVRSRATDRQVYLRRPDLGRRLEDASRARVLSGAGRFDTVFVVADGLSALAVQMHASRTIAATLRLLPAVDWSIAPFVVVEQGRVAVGDEIGECIGAALSVVLIGERPGMSAADSLGIYLTWNPRIGRTDAERNCISNIRTGGLSYAAAASTLGFLMNESRRRKLSGVALRIDAPLLPGADTDSYAE
jgi:ethanolamine ammonia-lyase small subunit